MLIIQVGALAFLYFNWNNNYVPYQFDPGVQKQITVTRWAAGIQNITEGNITALPTSSPSTILDVVRQWDQTAANVTNTKAIGAYNWMALGSSEIVYLNNTEYWVSPTTPAYPATDWISEHLIYTHAAKILVIDTYNGSEIPVTKAYGVPEAPPLYYGQGSGFDNNVYVHVPGYQEIGNASYSGAADYNLTGWQKSMWMTFSEGQLGFAFSGSTMQMLWNRNVFNRVQSVLIPGLVEDPVGLPGVRRAEHLLRRPDLHRLPAPVRLRGEPLPQVLRGGPRQRGQRRDAVLQRLEPGRHEHLGLHLAVLLDLLQQLVEPARLAVPQLRYPEQLLGTQSVPGQLDVDFQFHVDDPFIWRSGSQFYQRPTNTTVQYIPWAVGNQTYFAATQLVHYKNAASQNLAGMYIAYGGDQAGPDLPLPEPLELHDDHRPCRG